MWVGKYCNDLRVHTNLKKNVDLMSQLVMPGCVRVGCILYEDIDERKKIGLQFTLWHACLGIVAE